MAGGGHGMDVAAGAATGCVTPERDDGGRGTLCDKRLGMSGIVAVFGNSASTSRLRSIFGV